MEEIIKQVEQVLKYNHYKQEGDMWYGEIYLDYRDQISEDTVKKLMQEDNPKDTFYEWLWDSSVGIDDSYMDELMRELRHELGDVFYDNEDEIRDWVYDHVRWEADEAHFLDQKFCCDLIIDTGDGDSDFTDNTPYRHKDTGMVEAIEPEASILWLLGTQGYTKEDLQSLDDGT